MLNVASGNCTQISGSLVHTIKSSCCRKYYQKAVTVPTHHLDALWKSYESFEKSCPNKVLGKKLLEEMRSRYMSARRVYQERKKHLDDIKTLQLAVPPGDANAMVMDCLLFFTASYYIKQVNLIYQGMVAWPNTSRYCFGNITWSLRKAILRDWIRKPLSPELV